MQDSAQVPAQAGVEPSEYEARLVYSLLRTVVPVASRARLSAKRLQELVTMAYFLHLRGEGTTLREIAEVFDQSPRNIANLSKRSKGNFFSPELEHSLPRRIEFHLWRGGLTRNALCSVLEDHSEAEVDRALEILLEQGRARFQEKDRTYWIESKQSGLVRSDLEARIDGLNNLADAVGDLVTARFLEEDGRAMARTLTFRARPEDIERLKQQLYPLLRSTCTLMDETADADDDSYYAVFALSPVAEQTPTPNENEETMQ